MKKIGISFIVLNIAVVLGSAVIISGIGFSGVEGSFFPICALVAVTYVPLCLYTNIQNNKVTDWIVARTVEKNIPKHNFDKPYTIYVNNATLMLDIEGGRIAYISNLNPWKFQLIYAKDIDDIKKGYKNLLNTTNYVYFQFSYHGKVTKFPTFVSRELRSIETDVVQKALKKANICVDVLNATKYGTLDNKKFGCENKGLQQEDAVQERKSDAECVQEILIKEDKRSINTLNFTEEKIVERKCYSGGEGKPPIWIQPIIESGKMFDTDFFNFTNMLDWEQQGTDEAVLEPLIAFLAKWGDNVIFAFHNKMAELLYSLDTYNIAKHIIESSAYFSPDAFLYTRCVALINGKPYYNAILNGRQKLSAYSEFESILYVPIKAWERLHNEDGDKYPYVSELSFETYSNKSGWENMPAGEQIFTNNILRKDIKEEIKKILADFNVNTMQD